MKRAKFSIVDASTRRSCQYSTLSYWNLHYIKYLRWLRSALFIQSAFIFHTADASSTETLPFLFSASCFVFNLPLTDALTVYRYSGSSKRSTVPYFRLFYAEVFLARRKMHQLLHSYPNLNENNFLENNFLCAFCLRTFCSHSWFVSFSDGSEIKYDLLIAALGLDIRFDMVSLHVASFAWFWVFFPFLDLLSS